MKTPMTHLTESADAQEPVSRKLPFTMIAIYAILFGAWLLLQLHK
jgi:hypothetical protein